MYLKDPETDVVETEWVRTDSGSYVHEADLTSTFSGVSLADSDYECEHGRLAGDARPSPNWPHPHPCGCWPQELPKTETPDLMGVLIAGPKETDVTEQTEQTEAPYGRKADGTPRKRPAPTPAQMQAAQAGRVRAAAAKKTAAVRLASPPPMDVKPASAIKPAAPTPVSLIERMVDELDREIARLTDARDYLRKVAA